MKAHIDGFLQQFNIPRLLDVGCATGEFLYYLNSVYPKAKLAGVDIVPILLKKAQENVPSAKFWYADIHEGTNLLTEKKQYDAVFMSGVHSIFDDYKHSLNHLLNLVDFDNKGRAFIFGIFNPEDVDVLVKVKKINKKENDQWESGWNCFSKKGITNYLRSKGYSSNFNDFHITIDVDKRADNPLRSWTIKLDNGARMIVHGSQIIHHFSLLTIQL
ncbi:MAG: hypothetical protein A3E87_04935 [Gammaproteobacteria bacterium RIFCSPHIGHO2_12_FULL_35_23]|nr:MAG: hypothetical protein A3E87_04935 [Gammaproteobacteria bacterium RIFCSPHIGHO2_12_FULL_35_23]